MNPTANQIRRHFTDFEVFAEQMLAWHVEFRQLDRGTFSACLQQVDFGNMLVLYASFSRRLGMKGKAPPGRFTFGIPTSDSGPFVWRGVLRTADTIQVYSPMLPRLDATTPAGFETCTLSLSEPYLGSLADECGHPELIAHIIHVDALPATTPQWDALRAILKRLAIAAGRTDTPTGSADVLTALRDETAALLIEAVASVTGAPRTVPTNTRDTAVARARAIIENAGGDPLSVPDLCNQVGVSQRTLEYAFRERFGAGPKAYLHAHRLNQVRKQLREAGHREASITEIASRWGFGHMSQFAADYRKMFGELPSSTLKHCDA